MKPETKTKIFKILIIAVALVAIVLAIYLPLKLTGTLDKISTAEQLKEIILKGGIYSYVIFFVIQFLQTTFLPIPAFVTTVAGTLVFGPWITLLLSFISVMCASMFSFWLGRRFGEKLIVWVVGKDTTEKWQSKLDRGKYVFFLMMLFPVFPDDILCLIVGATTNITYKFFFFTNLVTRPIAIAGTCFLGSGQLIPFSGWGIPVWIVMVCAGLVLFYLSFKYQPQIENFVVGLGEKLGKKKQLASTQENTNSSTEINANTENNVVCDGNVESKASDSNKDNNHTNSSTGLDKENKSTVKKKRSPLKNSTTTKHPEPK